MSKKLFPGLDETLKEHGDLSKRLKLLAYVLSVTPRDDIETVVCAMCNYRSTEEAIAKIDPDFKRTFTKGAMDEFVRLAEEGLEELRHVQKHIEGHLRELKDLARG